MQRPRLTATLLALTLLGAGLTAAGAWSASAADGSGPTLTADVSRTTTNVNKTQFGDIVEDINHSVEGGLGANMVRNSTMKENGTSSWSAVTAGGGAGTIALDTTQPLNSANGNSLKLSITSNARGQRVGVANSGFYGIGLAPSTKYTATFFAKTDGTFRGGLTVDLESTTGTVYAKATVHSVNSKWTKYSVTMTTAANTPVSTANRFVIAADGVGAGSALYFDVVTCQPPTYHNSGLRKDLMDKLAATKPGFFRVPGGNYLEGNTLSTHFDWKTTIGPIENRPGHQNDAWGYWSTDQAGLKAYLDMAEQTGAQPLLAVFAGYTLNHTVVPQDQLAPYVQDALDEIQYAIGGPYTKWGAKRAADGHPAPYDVRYVEIGNEDWFDGTGSYNNYRFPMFHDAIKAAYPQLQLVASAAVNSRPVDVIDDHYYSGDTSYFTNAAHTYDGASRNGPKHLVGEYATTNGTKDNPTGTLAGAVSEAAFMTGMVRNADVVVGASYAPALSSVDDFQWPTNEIAFDAATSFGSPSYWVQHIFGTNTGDYVVSSSLAGADAAVNSVVTRTASGTVYVTVANPTNSPVTTQIRLNGATSVRPNGTATVLTGDPNARNSIAAPNTIAPTTSTFTASNSFAYTFPANSVVALKLNAPAPLTPVLNVNTGLSLHVTTPGATDRSVAVSNGVGTTTVVTASSSDADKLGASFLPRPGLADPSCYSLESRANPGQYLSHQGDRITLGTDKRSATFCAAVGNGTGVAFQAYDDRDRYLAYHDGGLRLDNRRDSFTIGEPWWRSDVSVPLGRASWQADTGDFLRHQNYVAKTSPITSGSPATDLQDATFTLVPGLSDHSCYSFEAVNFPGYYLRHYNFQVVLNKSDGSALFSDDATFCAMTGHNGQGISWQAYAYEDHYLRQFQGNVYIGADGGPRTGDAATGWADDTSWLRAAPWAA
ncbi:AbfB domain-containing protein [Kutzneria kofuensis]|uniref:non-reducing end alpha-L-arabinofuranosidase n=1 Tax=Kutzneria kofuensis TaxID=103725 RepID=A0A7W9NM10_9PSEU|nr:AbfB domain-containing protein [Kutzneria kofuensis]MBB5896858.1 alpha-L-arabinofuranosidase [Kutzneria kofuensis]